MITTLLPLTCPISNTSTLFGGEMLALTISNTLFIKDSFPFGFAKVITNLECLAIFHDWNYGNFGWQFCLNNLYDNHEIVVSS